MRVIVAGNQTVRDDVTMRIHVVRKGYMIGVSREAAARIVCNVVEVIGAPRSGLSEPLHSI